MLHVASRRPPGGSVDAMTAARSNGRVRVSGILQLARRGPLLMTDEGAWLLESQDDLARFAGATIVAEGERHGLDHIRADFIAIAPTKRS